MGTPRSRGFIDLKKKIRRELLNVFPVLIATELLTSRSQGTVMWMMFVLSLPRSKWRASSNLLVRFNWYDRMIVHSQTFDYIRKFFSKLQLWPKRETSIWKNWSLSIVYTMWFNIKSDNARGITGFVWIYDCIVQILRTSTVLTCYLGSTAWS
jgi:hypothetical protein